jgi:hypothetical protein
MPGGDGFDVIREVGAAIRLDGGEDRSARETDRRECPRRTAGDAHRHADPPAAPAWITCRSACGQLCGGSCGSRRHGGRARAGRTPPKRHEWGRWRWFRGGGGRVRTSDCKYSSSNGLYRHAGGRDGGREPPTPLLSYHVVKVIVGGTAGESGKRHRSAGGFDMIRRARRTGVRGRKSLRPPFSTFGTRNRIGNGDYPGTTQAGPSADDGQ